MQPAQKRKFGRVGLEVTAFGVRTAPLGNIFQEIDEKTSVAMFRASWDAGVRYSDAAPMYGHGLSDLRSGHSLRWKRRDDHVLSSKVGRLLRPAKRETINFAPWNKAGAFSVEFDYSYSGTMRSFEDSLQRMAVGRMDICFIHDIDVFTLGKVQPEVFKQAMDGCYRALRDQGAVKAIGVGVNEWEVCHAALQQGVFDCFLLAGRYTLLEQEALNDFLHLCGVVAGGGFNSGSLATGAKPGAKPGAKYNHSPAPAAIMDKVAKIGAVCADHNLPLAALQFVVAHPAIPSFIAGTRNVEQLQQNLGWFSHSIPTEFWADLKAKGLLREDAPVPRSSARDEAWLELEEQIGIERLDQFLAYHRSSSVATKARKALHEEFAPLWLSALGADDLAAQQSAQSVE